MPRRGSVEVDGVRLEVVEYPGRDDLAPLVFLHEGLGCVERWRSFPADVVAATGRRAVVYSRAGYGRSDPVPLPRPVGYMHHEARAVLPVLLDDLDVVSPVLLGHSDGASIALIHAGSAIRAISGIVALAPHVFVEDVTVAGIEQARASFLETGMRERLGRYHNDVDATFWGWNDVWLSAPFRSWDITAEVARIREPVLVVQGRDDAFGTLHQVDAIVEGSGGPVVTCVLDRCGHAPHLDRPEETLDAVVGWLAALGR
jgi:pimeloyl-ACP methyl ester carboxylesterase